jgi:hypothetical protein
VVGIGSETRPRNTSALADARSVRRSGPAPPLDKVAQAIVVKPMLDRFILWILLALIILFTVVMGWINWRKPPQ